MIRAQKFKATLAALFVVLFARSQTTLNVYLTDLQKRPVSFAIVKYGGNTFSCDDSGYFRINNYISASNISVYKFGFADTTVSVVTQTGTDTLNFSIRLRLKPTFLPEVTINSTADKSADMEEINPMKAAFVLGFELKDEYLVELLSDDIVLVTNAENKMVSRSRPIPGAREVVKDAYGTMHIVTDKQAFKIYPGASSLRVDSLPVDLAKLNWNLRYCDEVTDTSLFIRRYKDNNQTVAFFAISRARDKHVRLLKEITDVERKKSVMLFANETRSFNQYVASLGLSRGSASTQKEMDLVEKAERMVDQLDMNYALPSYSFLKEINDNIYLFAHDIDSLLIFDQSWNLVKSKRIDYHHLKAWGKELFVNEERTRVYARLIENSKPVLAEIDLQTGTLKPPFTVLNTKFPSKIKIRNNTAYFMAKQKGGSGYTVYSQRLSQ